MYFRLVGLTSILATVGLAQTASQIEFFEKSIRPVIAERCQMCHNGKMKQAGLDLSTAQGFVNGGASGPLVDKQSPEKSRLLRVVSYEEQLKMPPTGKLKEEALANLATWVRMGAPWPGAENLAAGNAPGVAALAASSKSGVRTGGKNFSKDEKEYWAFQPVKKPALPAVKNAAWVSTEVDRFLLAKLEAQRIKPAAAANKLTLLRRVTFDLTGLPPSLEEIDSFLSDASPNAYEKVVDKLLASPRYGERWGRHWLDVARYADSTGNDEDHRYPYAYRYRDYVIESFNNDLPYNQFVKEQIAGDLMPSPDGASTYKRGIVATGFLALGAKAIAQQDKTKMLYDVYDEQVDTVSRGILGITLACARCHDHKFDPLLTKDYYSMVNYFANTRSFKDSEAHVAKLLFTPLLPKEQNEKYEAYQAKIRDKAMEVDEIVDAEDFAYSKQQIELLPRYMLAARRVYDDKEPAKKVAEETQLKEATLSGFVKILKPSIGVVTPHLDQWHNSPADKLEEVAKAYQANLTKSMDEWQNNLNRWRKQYLKKMSRETNKQPPEKPKLNEEQKDGFFKDIFNPRGPFAVRAGDRKSIYAKESIDRMDLLNKELAELKKLSPQEPELACAVDEAIPQPVEQTILIRGDYNSKGEMAPKNVPTLLGGAKMEPYTGKGSGRLHLANWLASEENPLTARVIVNRVWYWHFGEGLVRTPDNFGKMGERPTHPELLDFLTADFVKNGWSVKKLQKTILLSSAYRMSSEITAATYKADPENKLWSRFGRRRLEVEEMRDGLLKLDNKLDYTMGGTMQKGLGTDGENSNGRLSINPEKETRRTVYLPLRRANLPSLLNLFDFGDATTINGKRNITNVAPQALFMMNSNFVAERAGSIARELVDDKTLSASARMERAYLRLLNRKPAAGEVDSALSYIDSYKSKYAQADEQKAWQSFCHILLGSNEFIYVD